MKSHENRRIHGPLRCADSFLEARFIGLQGERLSPEAGLTEAKVILSAFAPWSMFPDFNAIKVIAALAHISIHYEKSHAIPYPETVSCPWSTLRFLAILSAVTKHLRRYFASEHGHGFHLPGGFSADFRANGASPQ